MAKRNCALLTSILLLTAGTLWAAEWVPTTTELVQMEKPGYGKLSGVTVERKTGDVYVSLSDRGIFRSGDQGKTWQRFGDKPFKGRTEWPGCLLFDPTGKTKTLLAATVYGAPLAIWAEGADAWQFLHDKSSHVDWCAVDWSDPQRRWLLALKHEAGGLLLSSRDGGKSFTEVGKGYGPAWIFDQQTAVVAEMKTKMNAKPGLLRTTDGGKTFKRCGDYTTQALPKWHDGMLYWLVDGYLLTSQDKGETWKRLCDLKGGRYGPIFGKDSKHLLVLTSAGIVESTDAGVTWSKPIPLPQELKGVSPLTWLDYDAKKDILYVMKMTSELYKLERGQGTKP